MKKILMVMGVILLLAVLNTAAAEEFTSMEAFSFAQDALEAALKDPAAEISQDEMGYTHLTAGNAEFVYEQGGEYVEIMQVTLGSGCTDARGIPVGSGGWEDDAALTAEEVIRKYRNDNPRLEGTFEGALLYWDADGVASAWGICRRDGQRLTGLEYLADPGDGAACVTYSFRYDALVSVTYVFNDRIQPVDEADLKALEEERAYYAYYTGAPGEVMEAFAREDLILNYLDIMTLTEEDLTDLMGEALQITPSGDQTQYEWDGLTVTFSGSGRCETVLVSGSSLEGPRGIRVGDTLESVVRRFRYDGDGQNSGGMIYGDGQAAPYGMITFGEDTVTLTYCAGTDEGDFFLYCNFIDFALANYLIAR